MRTAQYSPVLSDRYEPIQYSRFLSMIWLLADHCRSQAVCWVIQRTVQRAKGIILKNKQMVRGNART